jgi:hypothetical protein
MAIPTTIESLSTTAASNGPAGTDDRSTADDGLRQAYAFTRQTVTLGSNIASASTITPPSTGSSFNITGVTAITTIASTYSWDGRTITLIFAGALTLTHSSNLALPGSANITTAANDVAKFIQTASGAWRCILYQSAALTTGYYLPVSYATRTDLKAVDTTRTTVAILSENKREGLFVFRSGDYSTHVAADTGEGIFVKATAIAATSGAWERVVDDSTWHTGWFGVPTDGTTDVIATFNPMMATANIVEPARIQFGNAIYVFKSKPTSPTFQLGFIGHGNGTQQTIIRKDYVEASSTLGLFALTTHGGIFQDLYFNCTGTASGGSAISAVLPADATNIGQLHVNRVSISGVNGFTQDVYIDGSAATSAPQGYRQTFFNNTTLFGGTSGTARNSLVTKSCQHFFGSNCFFQDKVVLMGTATCAMDDVQLGGVFTSNTSVAIDLGNGNSATDYITRCTIGGYVNGNVVNQSTNTTTTFINARISGSVNRNWQTTTCGIAMPAGALQQYTLTLANDVDANFGTAAKIYGTVHVTDSEGYSAIFGLNGAQNATELLAGNTTYWSTSAGTASKSNVFYNAFGYYSIQNKRGTSRNYSVIFTGSMASF